MSWQGIQAQHAQTHTLLPATGAVRYERGGSAGKTRGTDVQSVLICLSVIRSFLTYALILQEKKKSLAVVSLRQCLTELQGAERKVDEEKQGQNQGK